MEDDALSTGNFAEMLDGPDDNEQTDTDSQSDDTDQETGEETAQDDADGEAAEGDDEAQAEQPETDSDAPFLELEINGEKVAVSKDEAKNGYLRQQDYTQKSQNLARERSELHQNVTQQLEQVQAMTQEIGQLTGIDARIEQYKNVDWETLKASDPLSFATHLAEFNDLRSKRGEVVNGIGQKQAQLSQAQAQQFAAQSAEAEQHLKTLIPDFGKQHLDTMKAYGQKVGFTAAELAGVSDKRMLEVIWKASQYDAGKAAASKVVKAVAALPTRAAKPPASAKPAAQEKTEKLTRRLSQTGSVRDFAALLGSA